VIGRLIVFLIFAAIVAAALAISAPAIKVVIDIVGGFFALAVA
jgi:hypothetical protein